MQKPCASCGDLYCMMTPGDAPPLQAGSFALCMRCDEWGVFTEAANFRKPTKADKIPDILRFWKAGRKAQPREEPEDYPDFPDD